MCVSVRPATFGGTVVGEYEADAKTRVVFYQNVIGNTSRKARPTRSPVLSTSTRTPLTAPRRRTPPNWSGNGGSAQGNALVIPLMTSDFDSVKLLDLTLNTPNLLKDIRLAVQPPMPISDSRGPKRRGGGDEVRIRQFDIYTLVEASRASLIPNAVKAVEARKRPPLSDEIFKALEAGYDCPFAVACFNDEDAGESKPIAYSFKPEYPDFFMIYTLDSHDGKAPDLDAVVDLDHAVFVGSYKMKGGNQINYTDEIPAGLRKFVPNSVIGQVFPKGTRMINGDIVVSVEDARAGNFNAYRTAPPCGPARDRISVADALRAAQK